MNRGNLLAVAMLVATGSQAQSISITALGVSTGTDFNALVNTGTAAIVGGSPINGVYAVRTGTGTNLVADTGTSNGGNNYSYGAAAAADRALGSVGSGNAAAGSFFYGVRFTNNTGSTITSLTVNYVGEQWRNGGNTTANVVAFSYVTGAPVGTNLAAFQAAGTNVTALDFSSPINTATAAALDGNAAANRVAISSTITGLSLANGSEILLRWSDPDHGGTDHGLAIDDVFVTAAACVTNPVVNNTNDAGAGSLRQAVADACTGSTITFSPAAFATAQTIILTTGQISITQPDLTISGTGVGLLTVDGNLASRIFRSAATNLTLSGMTLARANGFGPGGTVGGAVLNLSGTLTVRDTRFTLNACNNTGAAIGSAAGSVVVERSDFLNNICGNVSAIYLQNGVLDIRDSTFTANVGNSDPIRVSANALNSSVLLTNTTITGQSSANQASALLLESSAGFNVSGTLINCTIVGNSTSLAGGAAIGQFGPGTRTLTLLNNIIVGNTANGAPADFSISADPSSSSNLVGTGPGLSNGSNNNQVGLAQADVLLSVLGSFGGPTLTIPLLPGSPAIDAGNGSGAPATDQRGVTRNFVDIGAFESRGFTGSIFSGDFQSTPVNTAFPQQLRVLVTANQAIEPVVGGRVTFTPPAAGASSVLATPVATITGASTAGTLATANGTPGAYQVQLDAAGIAELPSFDLENLPGGAATTLQFSAATYSVNENGTSATITVTATPAPAAPVSVSFASSDGTAVAGVDYTSATGTLNFGTGIASQTFSVPVSNDTTVEGEETVNLALSTPTGGATLGTPSTAALTISNDDSTTITVNAPSVAEGNAGTSPLPFTVSLSNPVQGAISLDYASADGNNVDPLQNATLADNDYQAANGVVSFPSDSTTAQTINVSVVGDTEVEPNQQLRLALSNLQIPASLSAASFNLTNAAGVGTINNDDGTTLSVSSPTQAEGNAAGTLPFVVTLSAASKTPVSVNFATANGTATAGTDYTAASGTLTFAPGGPLTQTVNVVTTGENTVEANETLTLNLSNPSGAILGASTGTGTLNNDDSATLSLNSVNAAEGNSGSSPLTFTVTLSAPVQGTVSATVNSADGNNVDPSLNATLTDNDYVAVVNGTVSIATGLTASTVVQMVGDLEVEPNQGLRLSLSNLQVPAGIPAGAVTLGAATGMGTINNDDGAALAIAAGSVVEGNAGTRVLNLSVTLSAPSKTPVTVKFATANGTATAGSDFVAASGTLTFAPGITTQQVAVTINGDTIVESDETFSVSLSAPSGATLATATATGTITNDDTLSIDIADTTVIEGSISASPTQMLFNVTLSSPSELPVTVDFATAGITAMPGADFTPVSSSTTFSPGIVSNTLVVFVVPDLLPEPTETLSLTLSNPQPSGSVTLGRATAIGSITNDDTAIQLPATGMRGLWLLLLVIGGGGMMVMARRER